MGLFRNDDEEEEKKRFARFFFIIKINTEKHKKYQSSLINELFLASERGDFHRDGINFSHTAVLVPFFCENANYCLFGAAPNDHQFFFWGF